MDARVGPLGPTLARIRGARRALSVADGARLTVHQLEAIEAGRVVPSLGMVRVICDALELPAAQRVEVQDAYRETLRRWRSRHSAGRPPRVAA